MNTHLYKHIHVYSTSMSTSERLSRLDLKIYEVDHQERLIVDKTSSPIKKIISHKYNTHVKYKI
jgi:hypothetical protein